MSRTGKIAVAVTAFVIGLGSFLLVVRFYQPGAPSSTGEPGGAGPPSTSSTASAQSTTSSSSSGRQDGGTPLIRDGAPAPTIGDDGPPAVTAKAETDMFPDTEGDNADDSAIWRNPADPARSLIVADNKADDGGVGVFDLTGKMVRYVRSGKIGNIDLRTGVRAGKQTITLVGANDRSTSTLRLWSLGAEGTLTPVEAGKLPTLQDNYGFCLGRTADGRRLFAFVSQEGKGENETGGGIMEQYELKATPAGRFTATKVRSVNVGSQSEGCVVDDTTGAVYVAQEDVGIWRYLLDPASGTRRVQVDKVGGGHLTADVEGISSTRGADGKGVLIASSQGDSTFSVYDLDGGNTFRGSFAVKGDGAADGVSDTDGLAVEAGNFGDAFPHGLLVAHDSKNKGKNGDEKRSSNLKFLPLDRVITLAPAH
ncbi:MAG: 3-phytase [Actinomycetota bacterium]|nr:3-phytase [Actinomycetota bacterium]